MGAFGIFVAVLTFIYIVYYAIMIGMDVLGDKEKKKDSVEVIAVGDGPHEDYVEQPTFVKENEDLPPSTGAGLTAQTERKGPSVQEDGEAMAAAILSEDDNKLYAAAKEAEGEMTTVVAESDDELTEEEYDNARLAQVVAEGDEDVENMSI